MDLVEMSISAYILAAGKGKRLLPFTTHIPKPMLPIINKSIIHYSIDHLLLAGYEKIGIVISKGDTIIPQFIQQYFPHLNPEYIVQEAALGTANAVLQIKSNLETNNFLVIAGDSLFTAKYLQTLGKTHIKEENVITLSLEKMKFDLMQFSSTVEYHDGRVWRMREKPATPAEVLSDLNSSALYIFSKSIFKTLQGIKKSERDEYELATAINKTIDEGLRVGGVITNRVCHVSNSRDLWHFNMQFLQEDPNRDSNGNVIGQNASFSDASTIENSVIGDNVTINGGLTIKNSVIMPNTKIERDFANAIVQKGYFEIFSQ
jgi:NDP-sugar pyrophosphorylase family protein